MLSQGGSGGSDDGRRRGLPQQGRWLEGESRCKGRTRRGSPARGGRVGRAAIFIFLDPPALLLGVLRFLPSSSRRLAAALSSSERKGIGWEEGREEGTARLKYGRGPAELGWTGSDLAERWRRTRRGGVDGDEEGEGVDGDGCRGSGEAIDGDGDDRGILGFERWREQGRRRRGRKGGREVGKKESSPSFGIFFFFKFHKVDQVGSGDRERTGYLDLWATEEEDWEPSWLSLSLDSAALRLRMFLFLKGFWKKLQTSPEYAMEGFAEDRQGRKCLEEGEKGGRELFFLISLDEVVRG